MEELNIKPNIQIMGALMSNACQTNDFLYINHLIDYMKINDINADQKLIERLEVIKTKFQKLFADYDWIRNKDIPQRFTNQEFRRNFHLFKTKYEEWLKRLTLEEEEHPWHQFQFQELPNKKEMHSSVKFMKQKRQTFERSQNFDKIRRDANFSPILQISHVLFRFSRLFSRI